MLNIADKLACFATSNTFGLRGRSLQTVIANYTFYAHQEQKSKINIMKRNSNQEKTVSASS